MASESFLDCRVIEAESAAHFPSRYADARRLALDLGKLEMSANDKDLTILVVDHNSIFLSGIVSLIRSQASLQLVGTATNAAEALEQFLSKSPRIALVDLDLPYSSALQVVRKMKKISAKVTIIGMATYEFDKKGHLALATGAEAVISKERIGEELMNTVRRICAVTEGASDKKEESH